MNGVALPKRRQKEIHEKLHYHVKRERLLHPAADSLIDKIFAQIADAIGLTARHYRQNQFIVRRTVQLAPREDSQASTSLLWRS